MNHSWQKMFVATGLAALAEWAADRLIARGSYELPMQAIFIFLLLGATSTIILFRRKWAPKVLTALL
ncbi:hypothetical protein GTP46_21050 [Duganella sp. FT135W]|uniref:Uncharacterized protein n=1 Tax=Duganella flavida TaxID=2692175 RepID=A0A6L8KCC0_9BURK|nr:hypothetical protein [Duganella flavida]MYM25119.1 hypothetical protein [Duganella flavida]